MALMLSAIPSLVTLAKRTRSLRAAIISWWLKDMVFTICSTCGSRLERASFKVQELLMVVERSSAVRRRPTYTFTSWDQTARKHLIRFQLLCLCFQCMHALDLTCGNKVEDSGITYTITDPHALSVSICRERSASVQREEKGFVDLVNII